MIIELLSLLVLGFAVSIDSFGVGFTYGLRRITVPIKSLAIIMLCTGLMLFASMKIGKLMAMVISPMFAHKLGASILIILGLWSLYDVFKNKDVNNSNNENQDQQKIKSFKIIKLWCINFGNIAIAIQVLKKPEIADIDKSGYISMNEAMILGLALAFDAFGAGIGAALIGYSTALTVFIISIMSCLFVHLGIKFGFVLANIKNIDKLSYLPGCILVILGLIKII